MISEQIANSDKGIGSGIIFQVTCGLYQKTFKNQGIVRENYQQKQNIAKVGDEFCLLFLTVFQNEGTAVFGISPIAFPLSNTTRL
jgi:hypothetical protein